MITETLGSLGVLLSANTSQFDKAMGAAGKTIGAFKRMAIQGLAFAGIGASIKGVFSGITAQMERGGRLWDMSQTTGVGVANLMVFQQALENAGMSAGMAGRMLSIFQRQVGALHKSESGKSLMAQLGLDNKSLAALKKLPVLDQVQQLGKVINKLDPGKKQEALKKLFGPGGYRMAGFFSSDAIADAKKGLGGVPAIIERAAAAWDKILESFKMAKIRFQGIFAGVAEYLIPVFNDILAKLDKVDLSKLGMEIGKVIGMLYEAIKNGEMWEMLKLGWKLALAYMIPDWGTFWVDLLLLAVEGVAKMGTYILDGFFWVFSWLSASFAQVFNKAIISWLNLKDLVTGGLSDKDKVRREELQGMTISGIQAEHFQKTKQDKERALLEDWSSKLRNEMTGGDTELQKSLIAELKAKWDKLAKSTGKNLAAAEEAAKPKKVSQEPPVETFVHQYAAAAVYGTAEAYRAEYGISTAAQDTADNTAAISEKMDEVVENTKDSGTDEGEADQTAQL